MTAENAAVTVSPDVSDGVPPGIPLHPLFTIAIEVEPADMFGAFPLGERRLVRFRSGTFAGPGIGGVLLDGGVDWQLVRPDGAVEISAHYALRTHEGEVIEVRSDGVRVMPPEVAARMAAAQPVDPSEYYFRTHIRLSTSAPRWDSFNRSIALSTGERRRDDVAIHVFEVG